MEKARALVAAGRNIVRRDILIDVSVERWIVSRWEWVVVDWWWCLSGDENARKLYAIEFWARQRGRD